MTNLPLIFMNVEVVPVWVLKQQWKSRLFCASSNWDTPPCYTEGGMTCVWHFFFYRHRGCSWLQAAPLYPFLIPRPKWQAPGEWKLDTFPETNPVSCPSSSGLGGSWASLKLFQQNCALLWGMEMLRVHPGGRTWESKVLSGKVKPMKGAPAHMRC